PQDLDQDGPWNLGAAHRPIAALCVLGCGVIIYAGIQPPNEEAATFTAGALALAGAVWWSFERRRFRGPPQQLLPALNARRHRRADRHSAATRGARVSSTGDSRARPKAGHPLRTGLHLSRN